MIFLLILLAAVGCNSAQPIAEKDYKKEMDICVNGHCDTGMIVVPRSSVYKVKATSKGRLDYFTYTSCHREYGNARAWDDGFFSDKKITNFEYRPIYGLEDSYCPLNFGGYETAKGRNSWAFADFEDQQLSGVIKCNGTAKRGTVTVCQSRVGLYQEISFDEETSISGLSDECLIETPKDNKTFKFNIKKGFCVYAFKSKKDDKIRHRLTTYGYDDIFMVDYE